MEIACFRYMKIKDPRLREDDMSGDFLRNHQNFIDLKTGKQKRCNFKIEVAIYTFIFIETARAMRSIWCWSTDRIFSPSKLKAAWPSTEIISKACSTSAKFLATRFLGEAVSFTGGRRFSEGPMWRSSRFMRFRSCEIESIKSAIAVGSRSYE